MAYAFIHGEVKGSGASVEFKGNGLDLLDLTIQIVGSVVAEVPEPLRPYVIKKIQDNSYGFCEQTGIFPLKASSQACHGQILTRRTKRDAVHGFNLVSMDFSNVAQMNHSSASLDLIAIHHSAA